MRRPGAVAAGHVPYGTWLGGGAWALYQAPFNGSLAFLPYGFAFKAVPAFFSYLSINSHTKIFGVGIKTQLAATN
jgi:hypothetical protein